MWTCLQIQKAPAGSWNKMLAKHSPPVSGLSYVNKLKLSWIFQMRHKDVKCILGTFFWHCVSESKHWESGHSRSVEKCVAVFCQEKEQCGFPKRWYLPPLGTILTYLNTETCQDISKPPLMGVDAFWGTKINPSSMCTSSSPLLSSLEPCRMHLVKTLDALALNF